MAYNREDMITWNELAPSLQTVLKGYESGIEALNSKYQEEHLSLVEIEGNLATFIQNQQAATEALQSSMDELNSTQKQIKDLASSLDNNVNDGFSALGQSCNRMEEAANNIKESGTTLRETCSSIDSTGVLMKDSLNTINTTTDNLYNTCKILETTCSNINTMVTNINVNIQGINTYNGNIDTACRILSQTCTDVKSVLEETKELLNTNHAEIKELLESIKENGISSGGGGTGSNTATFDLSKVSGGVEEFGSLTKSEQELANSLKSEYKTDEEIISLIRLLRENGGVEDPTATFNLEDIDGGVTEFGALTKGEQAAATALKQKGKSDEEIINWLRTLRSSDVFRLSDVEGAEEEFGELTAAEQAATNALKQNGKSNDEIINWLRAYRDSQNPEVSFKLSDVEGAEEEFGSLDATEQATANAMKIDGKTDEEIITWLRAKRLSESVFVLGDVEGGVEEFGSLSAYEQQQATALKRQGKSNEEILQWIRDYRYSQTFHLEDIEGGTEEFGSLTEDEQTQANDMKADGKTDEEIITWLRAKRLSESVFVLEDVEGGVEEFGSLTETEQTNCTKLKRQGKSDEEILQWIRDYRSSLVFHLEDIEGAEEEFGSLSDDEQAQANSMKVSGKTDEEILDWLRQSRKEANTEISNYADIATQGAKLDGHEQDPAAHKGYVASNTYMMHHPNTDYTVGDMVYIGELPINMALVATTDGTTSSTRPNFASVLGTDGDALTIKDTDTLLQERYTALTPKVESDSTTVDNEIKALHKEVYDHTIDPNAHAMTSTARLLHKTNYEYNIPGTRVFANTLDPNLSLEVYTTGVTADTAPETVVQATNVQSNYNAPTVTAANRADVMADIELMLNEHQKSTKAHNDYITEYLFKTNYSDYQYVKVGNSCRLCYMAG